MNAEAEDIAKVSEMLTALAAAQGQSTAAAKVLPGAGSTADSRQQTPVSAQQGADFLRDRAFAVFMSAAIDKDLAARLPITSFDAYHQQLLEELGNPTDPILKMIAQQLVIAHFQYLRMQVRLGYAKSAEECGVLGTTACHVMAEFRRSAVTLQEMRQSVPKAKAVPSESAAQSQTAGGPAIPKAEQPGKQEPAEKTAPITELGSKATQEPSDDRAADTVPFKKPKPRRRWKRKSA